MSTTLKWYGKEVQTLVDKSIYSGLTASAITLEGEIVKNIRSMRIIDTGRYMGSITYKTLKDNDLSKSKYGVNSIAEKFQALIGTNVSYAGWLEYGTSKKLPRPAIRKAFDSSKQLLQTIFQGQFSKIFNSGKIA